MVMTTRPSEVTLRASSTFNASQNIDFTCRARGVLVILKAGTGSGTSPTIDAKLQVKDPVSAAYVDMLNGGMAQIATNDQTRTLLVYPGQVETTTGNDRRTSGLLTKNMRLVLTIGGSATPAYTATTVSAVFRS